MSEQENAPSAEDQAAPPELPPVLPGLPGRPLGGVEQLLNDFKELDRLRRLESSLRHLLILSDPNGRMTVQAFADVSSLTQASAAALESNTGLVDAFVVYGAPGGFVASESGVNLVLPDGSSFNLRGGAPSVQQVLSLDKLRPRKDLVE